MLLLCSASDWENDCNDWMDSRAEVKARCKRKRHKCLIVLPYSSVYCHSWWRCWGSGKAVCCHSQSCWLGICGSDKICPKTYFHGKLGKEANSLGILEMFLVFPLQEKETKVVTCWCGPLLVLVRNVWFSVISMTENPVLAQAKQVTFAVGIARPTCTSYSPSPSAPFCGIPVVMTGTALALNYPVQSHRQPCTPLSVVPAAPASPALDKAVWGVSMWELCPVIDRASEFEACLSKLQPEPALVPELSALCACRELSASEQD